MDVLQFMLQKNGEERFVEDIIILRGRRHLATKPNITFFVGNEVLNIFHLTIFSKKKKKNNIF